MSNELKLFLYAGWLAFVFAFFYDFLRIFRRCKYHTTLWVALEDIFYYMCIFSKLFYVLHMKYMGYIRWYYICSMLTGLYLYEKIVSKPFIDIMSTIIYKIMWFLKKIIQFVLIPCKSLVKKGFTFVKKLQKKLQKGG